MVAKCPSNMPKVVVLVNFLVAGKLVWMRWKHSLDKVVTTGGKGMVRDWRCKMFLVTR
jgi:hypothetical protein